MLAFAPNVLNSKSDPTFCLNSSDSPPTFEAVLTSPSDIVAQLAVVPSDFKKVLAPPIANVLD